MPFRPASGRKPDGQARSRLGIDPLQVRLMNALETGDRLSTGQKVHVPAPVRECLKAAAAAVPLPGETGDNVAGYGLPGGAGRTANRSRIRRGIGFAVGHKNLAYSEGYDDDTRTQCRLEGGRLIITSAAAEIRSAGSSAASRQTYMSGKAIEMACGKIPNRFAKKCAESGEWMRKNCHGMATGCAPMTDVSMSQSRTPVANRSKWKCSTAHRQSTGMDEETGQGDTDVSWIFGAQRAVVDVDLDIGLVRVVQIATWQDVGRAINPLSVIDHIEGGSRRRPCSMLSPSHNATAARRSDG